MEGRSIMSRIAFLMSAIALGAVMVLAISYAAGSEAAKPPPREQPVREQNVDASGYIAVHEQGIADVNVVSMPSVSGGGCYTNWNSDTCAPGWTAVETGVWTSGNEFGGVICAAEKAQDGGSRTIQAVTRYDTSSHSVNLEPCAICCK
jgi:hypothetical protein